MLSLLVRGSSSGPGVVVADQILSEHSSQGKFPLLLGLCYRLVFDRPKDLIKLRSEVLNLPISFFVSALEEVWFCARIRTERHLHKNLYYSTPSVGHVSSCRKRRIAPTSEKK